MKSRRWIVAGVAALAALAFSTMPAAAGGFGKRSGHHIVHVPHHGATSFQFSFSTSRHALKHRGFRQHRGFYGPPGHRFGHRGFSGFKPHRLGHHRLKGNRFGHHRFGHQRARTFRHRW